MQAQIAHDADKRLLQQEDNELLHTTFVKPSELYQHQAKFPVHPFQQGFSAFEVGMEFPSVHELMQYCPFQGGTPECTQWVSGFYCASEHLNYSLGCKR